MASIDCPTGPTFVPTLVLDRTHEEFGNTAGIMTQSQVDAAQAVAVFRRIDEAAELLRFGEEDQPGQHSIDRFLATIDIYAARAGA